MCVILLIKQSRYVFIQYVINIIWNYLQLVNSGSTEIRRLQVRFPSEAQKHFSEFAINLFPTTLPCTVCWKNAAISLCRHVPSLITLEHSFWIILYIVKVLLSDIMYLLCIRICPINIAIVMAANSKSLLQNQISRVIVLVQKVKFDRF